SLASTHLGAREATRLSRGRIERVQGRGLSTCPEPYTHRAPRRASISCARCWSARSYSSAIHQSAIRRGRWVARVRYHAWRTDIPRVAWTNGTMAVPRRGVSRALWYRPRVRARGRELLTLRLRSGHLEIIG